MKLSARAAMMVIIAAAFLSFLLSVSIWFGFLGDKDRDLGLFVGLWVPSILSLGVLLRPNSR